MCEDMRWITERQPLHTTWKQLTRLCSTTKATRPGKEVRAYQRDRLRPTRWQDFVREYIVAYTATGSWIKIRLDFSELICFEAEAVELQRAAVLGHRPHERVGGAVRKSSLDFDRNGDLGAHLA